MIKAAGCLLELAWYWLRLINGVMRDETDLERLQRQVAKAKELVRRTATKAEELKASVEEVYHFEKRLIMFPRHRKGKLPVRADKAENAGDFLPT